MEQVASRHREKFRREILRRFNRRMSTGLVVLVILVPALGFLEFATLRQHFVLFLAYRIVCSGILVVLYYLNKTETGRQGPFMIAIMADFVVGLMISSMVVHLGGYGSHYYAGIALLLAANAAILPLDTRQSAIIGVMLYLVYCLPVISFSHPDSENLPVFLHNSLFLLAFFILAIFKCDRDIKDWKREFNLRMEIDALNERLLYYASNLEDEIDKRVHALEESELRYKQIYENIPDIVVLIDKDGKVLMATHLFYNLFGISGGRDLFFRDVVHDDDKARLEQRLFPRLLKEQDVRRFDFRMVGETGKTIHVECNARCVKRQYLLVGYQLVMRDVSKKRSGK